MAWVSTNGQKFMNSWRDYEIWTHVAFPGMPSAEQVAVVLEQKSVWYKAHSKDATEKLLVVQAQQPSM
jgi:hypothetical protein